MSKIVKKSLCLLFILFFIFQTTKAEENNIHKKTFVPNSKTQSLIIKAVGILQGHWDQKKSDNEIIKVLQELELSESNVVKILP